MKIGIYGGSFDPIHWGHLLLAETSLRECGLDQLVFVPTGVAPHKPDRAFAPAEDRINMLTLAISGYDEFGVSRFEIDSNAGRNYTIDTLRYFQETLLKKTFIVPELHLILGADMFNDLSNWYQVDEICRLAIPVVAARPNTPPPNYEALASVVSPKRLELFRTRLVPMPLIELSSTQIRKCLAEGKSIRFQTPRAVETYIATHGLYTDAGLKFR